MKNIFHYLSIIALMLTVSCSTNSTTNPPTQNPVDVYVAGKKDNHACYWKNNQIVILDNQTTSRSDATKIIISNNDVYVLGTFQMGINPAPNYVYWKNGVMTNLSQTLSDSSQRVSDINDMDVSGNDVYFVGSTKPALLTVVQYELAYWKNGIKTVFSPNNNSPTDTFIKYHNNQVYLIGKKIISGIETGGYFVNNDFNAVFPNLNGLTIKGNDIYVYGGNFSPQDIYYKNITTGQEVSFFPSTPILKMIFDGNDMYINGGNFIRKNDVTIYEVATVFDRIKDFEVLNGNTYIISQLGDFGTTDHLYINNVDVLNFQSNFSSMNDIAIVQN